MITIYISKADKNLPVDWDKMPEHAKVHIIEYGLRQKLNDAGSSATAKELGKDEAGKQAFAMAEVVLDALMAGNTKVRQAASGMTLEERMYAKVLKAVYKKIFEKPLEHDKGLEDLAKKLGKDEETLHQGILAKAKVEAETYLKIQALKSALPDIQL